MCGDDALLTRARCWAALSMEESNLRVALRTPAMPAGVEVVAGDATDPRRMREICADAEAVYNCVNPPFAQWRTAFPDTQRSLISAAGAAGAVLVGGGTPPPQHPDRPGQGGHRQPAVGHARAVSWARRPALRRDGRPGGAADRAAAVHEVVSTVPAPMMFAQILLFNGELTDDYLTQLMDHVVLPLFTPYLAVRVPAGADTPTGRAGPGRGWASGGRRPPPAPCR